MDGADFQQSFSRKNLNKIIYNLLKHRAGLIETLFKNNLPFIHFIQLLYG